MSEARSAEPGRRSLRLADGLTLAASPTFAVMALLTGVRGDPAEMLCAAAHPSPLNSMVAMYLLMSIFHAAPWVRRLRRDAVHRA